MNKILISIAFTLILTINLNAIRIQEQSNWCWASSIQDVLYQARGQTYSQSQIVSILTGWPQNRPAYAQEVVNVLRYLGLRSWVVNRPASPQELFNTLRSGWKLIAFVRPSNGPVGHFIVLQGFNPQNRSIIVSDPYTGRTYANSLNQLYYNWRWGASVVVGR